MSHRQITSAQLLANLQTIHHRLSSDIRALQATTTLMIEEIRPVEEIINTLIQRDNARQAEKVARKSTSSVVSTDDVLGQLDAPTCSSAKTTNRLPSNSSIEEPTAKPPIAISSGSVLDEYKQLCQQFEIRNAAQLTAIKQKESEQYKELLKQPPKELFATVAVVPIARQNPLLPTPATVSATDTEQTNSVQIIEPTSSSKVANTGKRSRWGIQSNKPTETVNTSLEEPAAKMLKVPEKNDDRNDRIQQTIQTVAKAQQSVRKSPRIATPSKTRKLKIHPAPAALIKAARLKTLPPKNPPAKTLNDDEDCQLLEADEVEDVLSRLENNSTITTVPAKNTLASQGTSQSSAAVSNKPILPETRSCSPASSFDKNERLHISEDEVDPLEDIRQMAESINQSQQEIIQIAESIIQPQQPMISSITQNLSNLQRPPLDTNMEFKVSQHFPDMREEFKKLSNRIDLTTTTGHQVYTRFLEAHEEAFAHVYSTRELPQQLANMKNFTLQVLDGKDSKSSTSSKQSSRATRHDESPQRWNSKSSDRRSSDKWSTGRRSADRYSTDRHSSDKRARDRTPPRKWNRDGPKSSTRDNNRNNDRDKQIAALQQQLLELQKRS